MRVVVAILLIAILVATIGIIISALRWLLMIGIVLFVLAGITGARRSGGS